MCHLAGRARGCLPAAQHSPGCVELHKCVLVTLHQLVKVVRRYAAHSTGSHRSCLFEICAHTTNSCWMPLDVWLGSSLLRAAKPQAEEPKQKPSRTGRWRAVPGMLCPLTQVVHARERHCRVIGYDHVCHGHQGHCCKGRLHHPAGAEKMIWRTTKSSLSRAGCV